jgi:transposase
MQTHREIIRLAFQLKLSANEIHRTTNVSRGTVQSCIKRATALNLSWPLPGDLDDNALEQLLYPPAKKAFEHYAKPDFEKIQSELTRKGVTLLLLWQEYKEEHPTNSYCYAHLAKLYRGWLAKKDVVMRQSHCPGEKLFVDFAGHTIPVICRETGEVTQAQIFVATLGASNFTYAEACPSQDLRNWLGAHVRAFRFFGGTPKLLVPDNLKSAVTEARRFDPKINRSYRRLAEHYGCGILPARPYRPRDKAKVEKAVQIVEQWILARLRNGQFFSIHDLNNAIQSLLNELNDQPFQRLAGCRKTRFEETDKPALQNLPKEQFEFEDWILSVKVPKDYHVRSDEHYYSIPYHLVGERVDIRATDSTVEIFHQNNRVASHVRSWASGEKTTADEHMTPSHAAYRGMSVEKFITWANQIGPATAQTIAAILASKSYPQLSYDQCFGILSSQVKKYGDAKVELACKHALSLANPCYRLVKLLLHTGLENLPDQLSLDLTDICHSNIRGPEHFS